MQASCDLASQLLQSTASDGAAQVMLCMPTYLPYIFYEGSRASGFIQPVSIFLGILLALLVVMLDVEAQVMWVEGREQHVKEVLASGEIGFIGPTQPSGTVIPDKDSV